MNHFNQLTPAQAERLALLIEECSEVIHAATKVLRHGYRSYHPNNPNVNNCVNLERELGDLKFAVHLMYERRDVDEGFINACLESKRENVKKYLHHQGA